MLRRVFERGAYADLALRAEARGLDPRDRALAMRLSYGAVQRRGTLDHLIERLAERPTKRLDAPLLAALRLGLYELLFLAGAPDHAVVADAVELAKADCRGYGLVNAVLRRATREGERLLAALDDSTPEGAALKHSHPEWIARLWWDELGPEDARALMAFDNEPAELALRVNTLLADPAGVVAQLLSETGPRRGDTRSARIPESASAEGACHPASVGPRPVGAHRDPDIPEAVVLDGPWDLHSSSLWRTGAVLAQSRGAMLPARALAPEPGERVLDLCAAPGGKTTHLAALMGGEGEVVAVEHNPRRAAELERTVQRLRAQACVRVVVGDAAQPGAGVDEAGARVQRASPRTLAGNRPAAHFDRALFDRVLVDPPCSGLGTLQARADLRWRVAPDDLPRLACTQAAILAAGAAAVRPGGVLVYSTCTISAIENEQQISAFLESHPDFALDDLGAEPLGGQTLGSRIGRPWGRCLQTLPHRDRTAGFFIARLRRQWGG